MTIVAWARQHNLLSWYIRPLFLLPFCYFTYRRSGKGIVLTVIGLAVVAGWILYRLGQEPRADGLQTAPRVEAKA